MSTQTKSCECGFDDLSVPHVCGVGVTKSAHQSVTVTTDGWARFPEVLDYARRRGITPSEAIRALVNSGLSHLDYVPVDPYRAKSFLANTGEVQA